MSRCRLNPHGPMALRTFQVCRITEFPMLRECWLLSSLSSSTCFLAPPKMSAKYRIPLRSDSWFVALIGEPIFNAPSGPLKGVGDEGTFWSPRCAVSGSFLGVCEPGLSAGEHSRGAVERHGAGRKRRHRQRGHCRSASHGHESFLYDQLKRFWILRRGEPSPGALRTDDGIYSKGFVTTVHKSIDLSVGQFATIDVTLKVATHGEIVVVTSETPVIEPTKTEISQVISTQEISSLPISGRLLLTPGIATGRTGLQSTFTEFEVTRVSFGGMRDLSNLVTVDGADNMNTATSSQRSSPPQEAISEFRVINSSFGAEYGRALGGIVNIVTKSGGNDFHGSLYDYFQNNATDARSLLQPAPQSDALHQNQFGATASGPIKKDKIFFFVNYEGQRREESPTYPTTLLEPVLAFSNKAPFAPTVQTTNLALINQAKEALGIAQENINILKTKDNDYGIVKVDDQLNADNHLTIRYNIEDGRDLNQLVGSTLDGGGIGAPSSGRNVYLRDQSLVGTVATILKPDVVNSGLVQYARRHYNFPGVTGQPNLDIPNTLLFGNNFGVIEAIYESRFQLSDSLTRVKGNHVEKFGGDFNHVNNFAVVPGFTPMRIVLPGINCLVDFANFVNPTADVPSAPADGPCPVANSPFFPAQPGPNRRNEPLSGVPIGFWGAPVGTVAPGGPGLNPGQLPTPPAIPTDWKNAYLPSETVNFSERSVFTMLKRPGYSFERTGRLIIGIPTHRRLQKSKPRSFFR